MQATLHLKSGMFDKTNINELNESYNNVVLFEPPKKVLRSDYICSNKFMLDYVLDMYSSTVSFGVLLISGNRTIFYKTDGQQKEKLYDTKVKLQKQQKKGGQSAQRIERLCEEKRDIYVKMIVEKAKSVFMPEKSEDDSIKGFIIAGPAELKHKVRVNPEFIKFFGNGMYDVIDTPELSDQTIHDLLKNHTSLFKCIANKEVVDKIVQIKQMIELADDRLVFGFKEVSENLKMCLLESVVTSDKLKKKIDKLNSYGCKIFEADSQLMSKISGTIDVVGVKYY